MCKFAHDRKGLYLYITNVRAGLVTKTREIRLDKLANFFLDKLYIISCLNTRFDDLSKYFQSITKEGNEKTNLYNFLRKIIQ